MRASDVGILSAEAQLRLNATLTNTPAWLGESIHLKGRLTVRVGSGRERPRIGQGNL